MRTLLLICACFAGLSALSAHYFFFPTNSEISYSIQEKSPGFAEAIYSINDVQDILNPSKCVKLRFYNAMTPEGKMTTIMIGVNNKGNEINGLLSFKAYKCYIGLNESGCNVQGLTKNQAESATAAIANAGFSSYSAQFTKESLITMIDRAKESGANAIRITPDLYNNDNSMRIEVIRIESGKLTTIETGAESSLLSTEPCPPVCGPDEYYLNR